MSGIDWKQEEKKLQVKERLRDLWMSETRKIVDLVKSGTPLIVAQRQIRRGKLWIPRVRINISIIYIACKRRS